ncbi:hypothetical protein Adi01nite_00870 [Amorphoplanes digitatis]|nr:hypothetical protein GCM10020092_034090 [Actinoplanes digitatis]GID90675.1 hypothetical protein Adi01nite_00870 [Actinoplanes digitatis]
MLIDLDLVTGSLLRDGGGIARSLTSEQKSGYDGSAPSVSRVSMGVKVTKLIRRRNTFRAAEFPSRRDFIDVHPCEFYVC